MYTGFEDMEAMIGELQNEIEALKEARDDAESEAIRISKLFHSAFNRAEEAEKHVKELEDENETLKDALQEALSGVEGLGDAVDKLYRDIELYT